MTGVRFRRAEPEDRGATFEVFRASLWHYVRQIGLVGRDEPDDVAAAWQRQGPLMQHLEQTAAEDWVAVDESDRVIGMARSVERDDHVELTHFFVAPGTQTTGVGHGLLKRAFPLGWGRHRSVIATQNPRALGLYLRFGVKGRGLALALSKVPADIDVPTTLRIQEVGPGGEVEEAICAIDEEVLGFRRLVDTRFLLTERPAYLFRKGRDVVGYLFAGTGEVSGPGAVLDRSDLPALIALQETLAHAAGHEETQLSLPMLAADTLAWAMEHGYRIDPFYEVLLSDAPTMKLDRYLLTQPGFIW